MNITLEALIQEHKKRNKKVDYSTKYKNFDIRAIQK